MLYSEAAVLEKQMKAAEIKEKMTKESRADAARFRAEIQKKRKAARSPDDGSGDGEDDDETDVDFQETNEEANIDGDLQATNEESPSVEELKKKYKASVLRNAELERDLANFAYQAMLYKDNLEDVEEECNELRRASILRKRELQESAYQRSQVNTLSQECDLYKQQAETMERLLIEHGINLDDLSLRSVDSRNSKTAEVFEEKEEEQQTSNIQIIVTKSSVSEAESKETPDQIDEPSPLASSSSLIERNQSLLEESSRLSDDSRTSLSDVGGEAAPKPCEASPLLASSSLEHELSQTSLDISQTDESPIPTPSPTPLTEMETRRLTFSVSGRSDKHASENDDNVTTCLDDEVTESDVAVVNCPEIVTHEDTPACTVQVSQKLLERLCLSREEEAKFEETVERLLSDHDALIKEFPPGSIKKDFSRSDSASRNKGLSKDAEMKLKRYSRRLDENRHKIDTVDTKIEKLNEELHELKRHKEEPENEKARTERKRLHKELKEAHHEADEAKEENASLMKKFERFKKSFRVPW